MTRNATQTGADMPDYTKVQEMVAYDNFPEVLRKVIREAPFDVSVADIQNNRAVMCELERRGADAPQWLAEQLLLTYRRKFAA